MCSLGVYRGARANWRRAQTLLRRAAVVPVAPLPPPKQHKFAYNLPRLSSYVTGTVPDDFWRHWQKLSLTDAVASNASWVNPARLLQEAERISFPLTDKLRRVCWVLEHGATLGCEGRGRLPTAGENSGSVAEHGDVICDVLQSWIVKGIAAGPLTRGELVHVFGDNFTINPMLVKPKPNGALRIIVDMSSPRDWDTAVPAWLWSPDMPGSVNSSIDPEQYETKMSSLRIFVRMLYNVGVGCVVFKIDWSDAYKHIRVADADLPLQVIQFGGRYFVETKLVFGSRSSPGNYDDLSDTVLDMAVWESQHPKHLTTKHLDDCLGAGMPGPDSTVVKCFNAYLQLAKRVGVRLLEPDVDKSKLQSPATTVLALGMEFDTEAWEVRCPEGKLGRLLHALRCMMSAGVTTAGELASLTGQIVDKAFLLEGGRFNIGAVIQQNTASAGERKEAQVVLLPQTREQLRWWFIHLQAAAWFCPIRHPDAKTAVPVGALKVWSDAAGGNLLNPRGGVGALLPDGTWVWFPWPMWLHAGLEGSEGYALNSQLQFLELVGPLLALATAPELFRNQAVEYKTDNQSAVFTWRKGYSKEALSTAVVKAVYDLSAALNSRPFITKVARCSTVGALAADHISKGALREFYRCCPASPTFARRIPVKLVQWLSWPTVDMELGVALAREIRQRGGDVLL